MRYLIHKLKQRFAAFVAIVGDIALFLGIVLIGGFGTSWYMVEAGSSLVTQRIGPWVAWTNAARADADPYTRAHFARSGSLPLTTDIAATFVARTDSAGENLTMPCVYEIAGKEIDATWWSLSVFNDAGGLLPNVLKRYGYSSETVALKPNGTFVMTLARDARPGSWIPIGGSGRLVLVLNVIEPRRGVAGIDDGIAIELPEIRKVECP